MSKGSTANGKALLVTGAYPPDICGVGEYTRHLANAAPDEWDLLVERDWSLSAFPRILRTIQQHKPTAIVLQYPTQGYGWSLVPHLILLAGAITGRFRRVLALHEFGSLSPKARLALALASHWTSHIVFTTEAERDLARRHPLFSSRPGTTIIPILSNIPFVAFPQEFSQRPIDIGYFGHVRPNKGIEVFLDTAEVLRRAGGAERIAVIGTVPAGYEGFAASVAERGRALDCELILELPDEQVASILAQTKLLYLPFPDGVSARRGSVLAGIGNGALIATTIGPATPDEMLPALVPCAGDPRDVERLRAALALPQPKVEQLRATGQSYVARALPKDWREVAALYVAAIARALKS